MFRCVIIAAAAAGFMSGAAGAAVLTIGSGDGSLTVDVDPFGRTFDAVYDPLSPSIGGASTIFDSYIAINSGPGFLPFDEFSGAGVEATVLSSTPTSLVSEFSINFLTFQLTQTVFQNFDVDTGDLIGATLQQQLSISNNAAVPNSFQLIRYLDGDLAFDGSIIDGGGVIVQNGSRVLFEVDSVLGAGGGGDEGGGEVIVAQAAATDDDIQTTFVGITAVGGTIPDSGSFQISSFSGLDFNIRNTGLLTDTIENDFDGDGFIDEPYDVTLALKNAFVLAPGSTTGYTTQTIFGNSTPPVAGESEFNPLLPTETEGFAYLFVLPSEAIVERQTIFIDPEIAVGYTYEVSGGADFFSVTAPSFAAVPDADGYLLTVNGLTFSLASGQQLIFGDLAGVVGPVFSFTITGVDLSLMLDPANTLAFVTGVALQNVPGGATTITQTPITVNTDAVVPLPATAWLMLAAFGGLGGLGLRRRRR